MRYLGGKARIAQDVAGYLNLVREPDQPYWEPFVGGGWILARINDTPNFASDKHPALIAMWQALSDGWLPPSNITPEDYERARNLPDHDPLKAFVGFGCSWGGKWFGGMARGKTGRNYAANAAGSLKRKIASMPATEFFVADFLTAEPPRPHMLIYCDPPYADTTGYAVGPFNHEAFWDRCMALELGGHTVVISEYEAPAGFSCVKEMGTHTDIRGGEGEQMARTERLFRPGSHAPVQPGLLDLLAELEAS